MVIRVGKIVKIEGLMGYSFGLYFSKIMTKIYEKRLLDNFCLKYY
jgi:hypothetical protein